MKASSRLLIASVAATESQASLGTIVTCGESSSVPPNLVHEAILVCARSVDAATHSAPTSSRAVAQFICNPELNTAQRGMAATECERMPRPTGKMPQGPRRFLQTSAASCRGMATPKFQLFRFNFFECKLFVLTKPHPSFLPS